MASQRHHGGPLSSLKEGEVVHFDAGGDVAQWYRDILGREPDAGGLQAFTDALNSGADPGALQASIANSPEAQSRNSGGGGGGDQGGGGGGGGGGGADLNALYQQYLGRAPDASGIASWSGKSQDEVIAGITGSQEYQQSHGGGGGGGGGNAQDLANDVFNRYATNQNYDQQLNQLNAIGATDPAAFYRARIGLLGKQMGWQTGQNTGYRNETYQNELNSLLEGARGAGLSQDEINNLVGTGHDAANKQNQARIAQDAASGAGKGWVNENIPGGYGTLAAVAAAVAAPYLAPELFAGLGAVEGGAALTTDAILGSTGFVPAAGSGASFALPGAAAVGGGAGGALSVADILGSSGFTPAAGSGASFSIAPGAYTSAAGAGSQFGINASPSASGANGFGINPSPSATGGIGFNTPSVAGGLGELGTGLTAEQAAAYGAAGLGGSSAAGGAAAGSSIWDSILPASALGKAALGVGALGLLGGIGGGGSQAQQSNPAAANANLPKGFNNGLQQLNYQANPVSGFGSGGGPGGRDIYTYGQGANAYDPYLAKGQQNFTQSQVGEANFFNPTLTQAKAGGGLMQYASGELTAPNGAESQQGGLLTGLGDGVSDDIPATIADKQPARLAGGEFIIPARIVSEIGNGSSEAGAKRLHDMMQRVNQKRLSSEDFAKNTKAYEELPA